MSRKLFDVRGAPIFGVDARSSVKVTSLGVNYESPDVTMVVRRPIRWRVVAGRTQEGKLVAAMSLCAAYNDCTGVASLAVVA